jgi:hypothetical protein
VFALFERRRKVSFIKALHALQSNGVSTYAYDAGCYVRYKGENGKSDTTQKA